MSRSMNEDRSQATHVVWINENEYYFVCSECHQRYSPGMPLVDRESSESYDQAINKVKNQQISCELCKYDVQELARQVQKDE